MAVSRIINRTATYGKDAGVNFAGPRCMELRAFLVNGSSAYTMRDLQRARLRLGLFAQNHIRRQRVSIIGKKAGKADLANGTSRPSAYVSVS